MKGKECNPGRKEGNNFVATHIAWTIAETANIILDSFLEIINIYNYKKFKK